MVLLLDTPPRRPVTWANGVNIGYGQTKGIIPRNIHSRLDIRISHSMVTYQDEDLLSGQASSEEGPPLLPKPLWH